MNWDKARDYAPAVVRIGLSLVLLWFGINQWMYPLNWLGWVPDSVGAVIDVHMIVFLNGLFEIVLGLLLLAGVFTRVVAFLLALHLLGITFSVGFNEIGVRDFGLTLAMIAVFLYGSDVLCWDSRKKR